jgi:hypothetical protein
MKCVLLALVAASVLSRAVVGQQLPASRVPVPVRQAWQSRFPGATRVEWKLKSDHAYEAEFRLNGVDVAAKFAPTGEWLESETTIPAAALTAEVRAAIMRSFKGYRLIETQRVERVTDPRLLLEVHLENAREVVKVQFEENGRLFAKSAKPKHR